MQAQSAASHWHAQGRIDITSTHEAVYAAAPDHVLLTAGGSALRIASSGITLTTPGPAVFKAAVKELTGAGRAKAPPLSLPVPRSLAPPCREQFQAINQADGTPIAGLPYRIELEDGTVLRGRTDEQGLTQVVITDQPRGLKLYWEPHSHPEVYERSNDSEAC